MHDTTSAEDFKKLVREFGRNFAMTQDMIRLGMLPLAPEELEDLKLGNQELMKLRRENAKISKALKNLPDAESLIKEIRKARIERVRKKRAAEKIVKTEERAKKKIELQQWKTANPPYLGEGVSGGLKFTGGEQANLFKYDLPKMENVADLAEKMKIPANKINWLSYHRKTATIDHYHRFKIPKSKGGFRTIASPKPLLRLAQSWILDNILNKIPLHDAAMAFRPKRSIVNNAERHKNGGVIIRIDLKDFFPSIKFRRIKGVFQSFGYNEGLATVFGLICTDAARMEAKLSGKSYFVGLSDRYLPQGACTSPALTNILCRKMDARMTGIAKKFGFTYTRYADDIVLSHPDKSVAVGKMINCTKSVIRDEGFEVHPDKLNVMRPHQRQNVTGIIVNEIPKVSRQDMRKFRSFLHHLQQEGIEKMSAKMGKNAANYAQGYWAFIYMVNPEQGRKMLEKHPILKEIL